MGSLLGYESLAGSVSLAPCPPEAGALGCPGVRKCGFLFVSVGLAFVQVFCQHTFLYGRCILSQVVCPILDIRASRRGPGCMC